ncbi:MAG: hypothetical protein RIS76_164 [Verrucomicrobiota bacterium]
MTFSVGGWAAGMLTYLCCDALPPGGRWWGDRSPNTMSKNTDLIRETLLNSKHPFRAASDRPGKPQKSRYERRKAGEILKIADWSDETAMA